MKAYALSPKGLRQFRQGFVLRNGLVASIWIGLALGAVFTLTGNIMVEGLNAVHVFALAIGSLLSGAAALIIKAAVKQKLVVWEALRLNLADDHLVWQQPPKQDMTIRRDEITFIVEVSDPLNATKGLLIRTANTRRWVSIPDTLESFAEIKPILLNWAKMRQYTWVERALSTGIFIGLLSCILLSFVARAPLFVLVVGLVAAGSFAIINFWAMKD